MSSFAKEYLSTVIARLKYYKNLGDKTFEQLTASDFHYQPNAASNSIAVIIRHLHGNMLSRWTNFLKEDGEKEWRQRDEEFAIKNNSKEELLELWEEGWDCFLNTLASLKKKDLKKNVTIRQEPLGVIDAINRQLAHYSYHIGQIAYIGRMIKIESWTSLSIPLNQSQAYDQSDEVKDPAKKFS